MKEKTKDLIRYYGDCIEEHHVNYLEHPNVNNLKLIYFYQKEYEKLTGRHYQVRFKQTIIKYIMTLTEITETEMKGRLDALPDGQTDTNNLVQLVDYSMIVATKDNYQAGMAWFIKS